MGQNSCQYVTLLLEQEQADVAVVCCGSLLVAWQCLQTGTHTCACTCPHRYCS
jgi:hypothetical protein